MRENGAVEETPIPPRRGGGHLPKLVRETLGEVPVCELRQARDEPLVTDADLDEEQGNHRRALLPLIQAPRADQWLIVPGTLPTLSRPTSPSWTLAKLCETNG